MSAETEERVVILPMNGDHEDADPCLWRQSFRLGDSELEIAIYRGRVEQVFRAWQPRGDRAA